jgi:hypothetical protein
LENHNQEFLLDVVVVKHRAVLVTMLVIIGLKKTVIGPALEDQNT